MNVVTINEDPDYNFPDGDFSILTLSEPVTFSSSVRPVCLPSDTTKTYEGEVATVTGWGKPSDNAGGISDVLREVRDVPIMSNSDCNDVYGIVGDGVICIDTAGGRGSCNVRTLDNVSKFNVNMKDILSLHPG